MNSGSENKYRLALSFSGLVPGFGIACLALSIFTARALAVPPPLDGTYRGSISINDGVQETIPLAATLTMTNETETITTPGGVTVTVKVIEGNFLIDKEGGPYAFTKITYRLEISELDMRYNRTRGVTVGQPSSYRLIGNVHEDGSIQGRVLSGFKGDIGTFILKKSGHEPLTSEPEYSGVWVGAVKILPEGDLYRFGLTIAETGFSILNPPQFEFDYSLSKLAHINFNGVKLELHYAAIDYLHRRIQLSDTDFSTSTSGSMAGITVQADLDVTTQNLKGYFSSVFQGQRGEFTLTKLNQ